MISKTGIPGRRISVPAGQWLYRHTCLDSSAGYVKVSMREVDMLDLAERKPSLSDTVVNEGRVLFVSDCSMRVHASQTRVLKRVCDGAV